MSERSTTTTTQSEVVTAVVSAPPTTDRRWVLFAMLVVLNIIDIVTTVAVIDAGGQEGNPFVRPLIDGVWPAILAKGAVLAIIAVLLRRCDTKMSRPTELALVGATGWYLAVVSWNTMLLVSI